MIETLEPDEAIIEPMELVIAEGISEDELEKAEWLLNRTPDILMVVKNYQFAQRQQEKGLNQYDLANAEGGGMRESGTEGHSDVTANTVILHDKREAIYHFYLHISNIVTNAIECLHDPHQKLAAELLFLKGFTCNRAAQYLESSYRSKIPPISSTTFFEKRRKLLASIAAMLSLNGILDYVKKKEGAGKFKDRYTIILPNWTDYQ